MNTMNKKERRQERLNRHYRALEALARATGDPLADWDGKKLSTKLLGIERLAHASAEAYCNGVTVTGVEFGADSWDIAVDVYAEAVKKLFGGYLPLGFFVNGDPRGCALKLNNVTEEQQELIADCGLERDWGGYGLLAPEIN